MILAKAITMEAGGGREPPCVVYCPDRSSSMAVDGNDLPSSDDLGKKTRKAYTITKSRESWTEQDHDKFLEALQLFDRDWKKIEAFVGSKTVIQIRSHAQKYFLKVQKNGTNEHVPPPRPKRKAVHPYPQKAAKNGVSSTRESTSMPGNHTTMTVSSLIQRSEQPVSTCHLKKDAVVNAGVLTANNSSCTSTESPGTWSACEAIDQENLVTSLPIMPDFAQVYGFLGSLFDPSASGHLQKLKAMDPIDVETVLILMRNLALNLTCPESEDHRMLLSTYGNDMEEVNAHNISNLFHSRDAAIIPLVVQGE
ncbi:protein REVEILLE 6-like isoform X2 [Zingiber officinale]|uniref:protein REVEILLE 6-like isoform X2 n=1 Tax=Zingiber officinale TaxID=94328 RepID=UPI001C4B802B|nr:protein REVEILLE 6-like isoform X2 [Zingiber officinale]